MYVYMSAWKKVSNSFQFCFLGGRLVLQALDGANRPAAPRPIASPQAADVQKLAEDLKERLSKEKKAVSKHVLPPFAPCQ